MEKNAQQGSIYKAEGVTPAERYLQRLCQHSFLSLWSYSGLYKLGSGVKTRLQG
jgi:hypothetical protein